MRLVLKIRSLCQLLGAQRRLRSVEIRMACSRLPANPMALEVEDKRC